MNRVCFLLVACCGSLLAQLHPGLMAHEATQSQAIGQNGSADNIPLPRPEKGKPFSAMVKTQTVQTFLDGTRVNQTTTRLVYRDFEGRVRSETLPANGSAVSIVIRDPVAGVTYRLNPAAKSAVKDQSSPFPGAGPVFDRGSGEHTAAAHRKDYGQTTANTHKAGPAHSGFHLSEAAEDLGLSNINGVTARGTRIQVVVPVGAIGNDREFHSTEEHWFSAEMNLIIKSVSTDPRFGTTTYELTNIDRQTPDPALFQVPSFYVVSAARDSHDPEHK